MCMDVKKYSKYLIITIIVFCVCFASIFFFKLYPLKHKSIIINYASMNGIQKELVAGIINIESSFRSDVVSGKGAVGLMQLLPSTAKWMCEKKGINYNYNSLFMPEYNICLGCYYLSYLINKFNNVNTAVVAYNAGEGVVLNWLQDNQICADGKTLNAVPYKETENYLKRVMSAMRVYKVRF